MQNKYHDTLIDQETLLNNMLAKSPFGTFFGISQKVFDQVWTNLTAEDGNAVTYISMEIGADLDIFNPVKTYLQQKRNNRQQQPDLTFIYQKIS